jgi:NAD(P)-dependent dehydrogenase (short-subunit alcohol dehydrogenase family)
VGRLAGKAALITGGASGIGKAAIGVFVEEGARVLVMDVQEEAGRAAAASAKLGGGEAAFVAGDVSRTDDVTRAMAEAKSMFGGLDILFANAGVQLGKTVEETSEEEWDRLMSVNLRGSFLCCKQAIPMMRERGGGSIVITSSVNGMAAEPRLAAYCASKGALIMLARSIALDYGRFGIRANALCPGWVDTPINKEYLDTPENRRFGDSVQPRGRIGTPEEIARVAAFLASDEASFMTGSAVTVDGGIMSVLNGHQFPPS